MLGFVIHIFVCSFMNIVHEPKVSLWVAINISKLFQWKEHSSNPDDHAENNMGQQQQQKDEGWLLILVEHSQWKSSLLTELANDSILIFYLNLKPLTEIQILTQNVLILKLKKITPILTDCFSRYQNLKCTRPNKGGMGHIHVFFIYIYRSKKSNQVKFYL